MELSEESRKIANKLRKIKPNLYGKRIILKSIVYVPNIVTAVSSF